MRSVSGITSTSSRGNAKARGSRQNRSCVRFTVEGLDLSSQHYNLWTIATWSQELRAPTVIFIRRCAKEPFFFGFEWRRRGHLLAKKWGPTDLLQRGELRAYIPDKHWPSSQRSNLSLEAILVSPRCLDFPGSRQFCVSRLQKIKISFLEFFTRQK